MEYAIRPATLEDLEAIVDFNLRLAAETEDTELDRETARRGVRGLRSRIRRRCGR